MSQRHTPLNIREEIAALRALRAVIDIRDEESASER